MEYYDLTCNKCHQIVGERAVITVCFHIFCLDCVGRHDLLGEEQRQRPPCIVCNSPLPNEADAVVRDLNPTEDVKSTLLNGFNPVAVMESAARALNFWHYQLSQEIMWQRYNCGQLITRYSELNSALKMARAQAESDMERLRTENRALATERDVARQKNAALTKAKDAEHQRLLRTQELYEKVKRKIELESLRTAASEAADLSVQDNDGPSLPELYRGTSADYAETGPNISREAGVYQQQESDWGVPVPGRSIAIPEGTSQSSTFGNPTGLGLAAIPGLVTAVPRQASLTFRRNGSVHGFQHSRRNVAGFSMGSSQGAPLPQRGLGSSPRPRAGTTAYRPMLSTAGQARKVGI